MGVLSPRLKSQLYQHFSFSFHLKELNNSSQLLNHFQILKHDKLTMTYLKVDSLNGCSRLTLTMLINSSKVNTREGKSWSGGSEELETHCSSNWIFFLDKCIFNISAPGSWFSETWRRSHGFGAVPLYRAQMGKGLAQERQPEIDNMPF